MTLKTLTLTAALFSSTLSFAAAKVKAGDYAIDPAHSKIGFEIPHLVISTVEGRFTQFEGKVVLADAFEKSTFNASIDVNSIDTGVGKRDEHLRSPDFFDVKKFPSMKFESTAVKGKPEAFKISGNLTLHGVTKPVTLDAKYLGVVADGYGNEKAAFKATGKINRKDFGLNWSNAVEAGPVVGDEVTLELNIQAGKPLAAAPKK